MANPNHLAKISEGVEKWNAWRRENKEVSIDLSAANLEGKNLVQANLFGADLNGAFLQGADLTEANLSNASLLKANLRQANLSRAEFRHANLNMTSLFWTKNLNEAHLRDASMFMANLARVDLSGVDLSGASLMRAKLRNAKLRGANLRAASLARANLQLTDLREAVLREANISKADLTAADLSDADLTSANLEGAHLEGTCLDRTTLSNCQVYGVSVWDVRLDQANQSDLVITPRDQPRIQVDNLEVAQFIYLLLNNKKIREAIDTIGKKTVLLLGRFTGERKAVLEALRDSLRRHGYLPILFDFERPSTRDTLETIVTLAGLARFIIADISDPKSVPQELASIVPNLPSVPVQPLLQDGYEPWGMYDRIERFPWVLSLVRYTDTAALLTKLKKIVIDRAEMRAKRQAPKSRPAP